MASLQERLDNFKKSFESGALQVLRKRSGPIQR